MNDSSSLSAHNEGQHQLLRDWLQASTETKVAFAPIICQRLEDRNLHLETIPKENPEFQHLVLDLGEDQVHSLVELLRARYADLLEVDSEEQEGVQARYLIHLMRLETSFFKEILDGEPSLLQQLQAEVQTLARFPLHLLVWTDEYTLNRLQAEVPELWSQLPAPIHFQAETEAKEEETETPYAACLRLAQALQAEADGPNKSDLYVEIGELFAKHGKLSAGQEYLQQALEYAQVEENNAASSRAYLTIGDILLVEGDVGQALECYRMALDAQEEGTASAELNHRMGQAYLQLREFREALPFLQEAIKLGKEEEAGAIVRRAYGHLAQLYENWGKPNKAIATYHALAAEIGEEAFPEILAHAYQQIGAIHQARLEWNDSYAAFQKALEYAQQIGDEFLIQALEDSVEILAEKVDDDDDDEPAQGSPKKKSWLGRLFGG